MDRPCTCMRMEDQGTSGRAWPEMVNMHATNSVLRPHMLAHALVSRDVLGQACYHEHSLMLMGLLGLRELAWLRGRKEKYCR